MGLRVRRGQWHYRFHSRGRGYTGSTGLDGSESNRSAAEAVEAAKRAEIAGRRPRLAPAKKVVSVSPGFSEAAVVFLEWAEEVEYRAKPRTAARIATSFASMKEFWGATPVRSIDGAAIERYKAYRIQVHQVRDVTVRHDLHALSVFLRYGRKLGWVTGDPMLDVKIPSDRDAIREHVVTAEEEQAYFAAAAALHLEHKKQFPAAMPNLADLARLLLDQGARPEEIMAARSDDFDAAAGTLHIRGGKSRAARRVLYLTEASREILVRRQALKDTPWLFPSDRRPGHHLTQMNHSHDRVCREAGVSFVLYDLRHTFATRRVGEGAPVAIVAAIMGHSGLRTIGRYVHPTADMQKSAMDKSGRKVG